MHLLSCVQYAPAESFAPMVTENLGTIIIDKKSTSGNIDMSRETQTDTEDQRLINKWSPVITAVLDRQRRFLCVEKQISDKLRTHPDFADLMKQAATLKDEHTTLVTMMTREEKAKHPNLLRVNNQHP